MALSTHSGGAADKVGCIYESLWGVRCMIDVLDGKALSIKIESPGEDGEEFQLNRSSGAEHWQVKRQVTGQETWSFQKMKPVLLFFAQKCCAGDKCVFASVSDAPELRTLTENAQANQKSGSDIVGFKKHFLDEKRSALFCDLTKTIGAKSEQDTYNFLCSISVEGGREITLEREFGFRLSVMYAGPWQTTMALLRELYLKSVHETLTAPDIENFLQAGGIVKRHILTPDVQEKIGGITRSYIAGQQAKFIRRTLIKRKAATDIVTQIQTNAESLDILITSAAGGGKSACMCQIVEELQAAGIPVLAFRLDSIEPVATSILLGEKLGLDESPAFSLSESFVGRPVVLVIDQLDYVSTTSGRHSDFFDTVAALHDEVVGLRQSNRVIHWVLACRKFDFEHDNRLKGLVSEKSKPVELSKFSLEEVKQIVELEGGNIGNLNKHQQSMLQLPQNLSLFTEAGLSKSQNSFSTVKQLCDAYWDFKKRAVCNQANNLSQYWNPTIQCLSSKMSERQELSVPANVMDDYPPALLEQMVSEGVLTYDGKRYGFGHESFFDYCFARTLPNGGRDFIQFLENDSQHLFRRAQLRQVLVFLRDDDFQVYLSSLKNILNNEKIRTHLKILAVELVSAQSQPRDEELQLLMPSIESEISCRREKKSNLDKLASRVWEWFLSSRNLFIAADRMGIVQGWLKSSESWLLDTATFYLSWQTQEHSERIAELLEPFIGNPEWRLRLRYIMEMESRHLGKSRRFFDLFLRLLEDGTLDDAKDRFASNGTFWSMFYDLENQRPDWYAELAAKWLDRQVAIAKAQSSSGICLHDGFGVKPLFTCAQKAPKAYLDHVLPAILRTSLAFVYKNDGKYLLCDAIWPHRVKCEFIDLNEAFLSACEGALKIIGEKSPDSLRPYITQLQAQPLNTANHLLLSAYLSNPTKYADEALCWLADDSRRLLCGYSDSTYWQTRSVIEKCSPLCSEETFHKLEATIIVHISPYEKTKEGIHLRGYAAYNLTSSLAENRITTSTKTQLEEWKEKFKQPDGPPVGIHVYSVTSPIKEDSANHMTDEQWLSAIAKYNTDMRIYSHEHPEKGGAPELADLLENFTQKQPERFAKLSLRFPDNSHPYYFSHVIRGLEKAKLNSELKLSVARRVFRLDHRDCLDSSLRLIASITDIDLPDDTVQFVKRAAENSDPQPELSYNKSPSYQKNLLNDGINTIRGTAAWTIRDLIIANGRYIAIFSETIETMVNDPSLAVRACVVSTLRAVAKYDVPHALKWWDILLATDDRLLATHDVQDFIYCGLPKHMDHFSPIIQRMLESTVEKARETGGTLACLARLYHPDLNYLAEAAMKGDVQCRLGAADVASRNVMQVACRAWCEEALDRLFDDENQEVRKKAAGCFWQLWHSPDTPLTNYDKLIRRFLSSAAFLDEPTYLLHALDENRHLMPEAVLDVCDVFIDQCAVAARDIRTSLAGDEFTVAKLVFTAYAQLQSQKNQIRALDTIDHMSKEGLNSATRELTEFDR